MHQYERLDRIRGWTRSATLCRLSTMKRRSEPRLTHQSLKVLRAFLDAREFSLYGGEVIDKTGLFSGTAYPILYRFESAGWLLAEWETLPASELGRPRRRRYRLTGDGQRAAAAAFAELGGADREGWAI